VLHASQPQKPPPESILTTLLNEISAISNNFILVLDDYHVIDSKAIGTILSFLLKHLPPQMHLVITTREDPNLPLARLRARDQLTGLRATDLRFTPAEAAEFLNQAMSLNLSAENIAALEARTEGWIAGLQLAALSMQGRSDTAGFIQAFTGSHRFVLDYLAGEVLERQPERVRNFLLQTAILDRLSGSLCDAVTAQDGGRGMLETLERGNLFVVPLDDQRQWYRYHHLFADVLQAHLIEAQPEQVSSLHQRASEWYEQNGLRSDAIRHALAARDFERAAGLIELAKPAMDINYQSSTWLGWVKALPDVLIRTRPVLIVGYAWALLDGGELEASEAHLQDAERWLNVPTDKMVVVDKEQFRSLPASIATARAYRSLALGDIPCAIQYAQQGLDLTPEDDDTVRALIGWRRREGIRRDERSESEPASGALESRARRAAATTQQFEISRERKRFRYFHQNAGSSRASAKARRSKPHSGAGTCTNAQARRLAVAGSVRHDAGGELDDDGCRRIGPGGACGPAHGSGRSEDRGAAAGACRREQQERRQDIARGSTFPQAVHDRF
jgi:LuxR family maltose regulon positive regulatory protein